MAKNNSEALPQGTWLSGKEYKYHIVRVLGQGSFGITYLATVDTQNELGDARTFVCVKEFFMHEVNGRDGSSVTSGSKEGLFTKYRHKFVNEAKRLGELHHRNIVRVIESFEANNTVYYSMQLIEGGTLDDMIKQRGRLGEKETLKIADKIAKALDYMHSWNMLHLDMKPSNVMMQGENPVVIDFGLSKQYDEDGNPESSTTIGGGTPGYAPIEQTTYIDEPHKELPVTMDIYALGATIFKMLTGERPPLVSDILNEGFPFGKLKEKGVSEETIQLVSSMMHLQKNQRIQTLSKVRTEIGNILKNLPDDSTAISEKTNVGEETAIEKKQGQYSQPYPTNVSTYSQSLQVKSDHREDGDIDIKDSVFNKLKIEKHTPKKKSGLSYAIKWAIFVVVLIGGGILIIASFNNKKSDINEGSTAIVNDVQMNDSISAIQYLDSNEKWDKGTMEDITYLTGLFDDLNNFNFKSLKENWAPKLQESQNFQRIIQEVNNIPESHFNLYIGKYNVPNDPVITVQYYINDLKKYSDEIKDKKNFEIISTI